MLDTLETLCCLDGVSGAEKEIRDYILERAMPLADEIRTDLMGNLIFFKKGAKQPQQRIMLSSHMDEVGLIITHIEDSGYLRFAFAGGVDRRVLMGKKVYIGAQRVPGFIGTKAMHLTTGEQRKVIPELSEMFIDIGVSSRQEAEELVAVGDCAAFDDAVIRFGDGYIKAKAIDDRVGCAAMLKLLESDLPCDCWFAFTVQEEVGCRGASVAANIVDPDIAIVLEGTTAADLAGVRGADRVCSLGGGVVIPFMDGGTIYDRALCRQLAALAEAKGIPWQTKTRVAGGTDASVIQRQGSGTRVAALSVAVRNLHSPACVAKIDDCEAQWKLANLFLEEISK